MTTWQRLFTLIYKGRILTNKHIYFVSRWKYCIFATMNNKFHNEDLSENVILADGDYVDKVAFDLTVNFERMIGRRIPKADTARWIDCVALDGGLREGDNKTQVIIIHDKSRLAMENFVPGVYADELDGKAFSDNLGEFLISSLPIENDVTTAEDMFIEALEVICNNKNVKRIMVIPDAEKIYSKVRETLRLYLDDENKRATVFAMQPMHGGNFRQEILGYSLMQALGIKSSELNAE